MFNEKQVSAEVPKDNLLNKVPALAHIVICSTVYEL